MTSTTTIYEYGLVSGTREQSQAICTALRDAFPDVDWLRGPEVIEAPSGGWACVAVAREPLDRELLNDVVQKV
jgi:hypothetical protein